MFPAVIVQDVVLKITAHNDRDVNGNHIFDNGHAHTAIVKEKDTAAYRRLVEERQLDPARTWMVGNSPKSDINPAMEAGLNAVFIPHAHTWVLEKQEIRAGAGQLLLLDEFAELKKHF